MQPADAQLLSPQTIVLSKLILTQIASHCADLNRHFAPSSCTFIDAQNSIPHLRPLSHPETSYFCNSRVHISPHEDKDFNDNSGKAQNFVQKHKILCFFILL